MLTKLKCGFPVCDSEDATPSNSDRDMQEVRINKTNEGKKSSFWCGVRVFALPGLGPRGVNAGLSRVRWSLGRRGAVCVSGLASALGCVVKECDAKKSDRHTFY